MKNVNQKITIVLSIISAALFMSCTFESAFVDLIQEKINADLGITSEEIVPVTGITLDKPNLTVTSGYTEQLTAVIEPPEAADQSAAWSSSDESVAEVDDAGMVTGTGPGSATITAAASGGDFTARCEVLVLPKGEIDTSFNTVGYVRQEVSDEGEWRTVTTDGSGRIIAAGQAGHIMAPSTMICCRYTSAGSLDSSFSSDGIVELTEGSIAFDAEVDSSGRIVIAGELSNGHDRDTAVWRFKENGDPDNNFSDDGVAVYDNGNGADESAKGLIIDTNGKIVITGRNYNGTDTDMIIRRYNDNGSDDNSLDTDGLAFFDSGEADDGSDIAIDENGKILVAGSISNGTDLDIAVWRYNTDGSIDTSFNNPDGFAVWDGGSGNDSSESIAVDGNGRIVVAGRSFNGDDSDTVVLRYNNDGSLDNSFSSNGYDMRHNIAGGEGSDWCYGVSIDKAGRILVAGHSSAPVTSSALFIYRYINDGTLDQTFGADGVVIESPGERTASCYALYVDSRGRILIAGSNNYYNTVFRFE